MSNLKKYVAEFIGTAVLVAVACGVAVATGCEGPAGVLTTALAFGLVIVAMAFSVGNISGCHINPAVSVGMLVSGKISLKDCIGYVVAQVLGAFTGSFIDALFFGGFDSLGANQAQPILVNAYGDVGSLFVALAVEIVLTFIFVFAIIGVTSKVENNAVAGIVIGLTLTLVHLLGIYLTGTSVNPARSLAPAVLSMIAGNFTPISQIWIFIVGPIAGGVLAALAYKAISSSKKSA